MTAELGGYSDWRVPNVVEACSLMRRQAGLYEAGMTIVTDAEEPKLEGFALQAWIAGLLQAVLDGAAELVSEFEVE